MLAAHYGERVVGGLIAYELQKFEKERSEIYLYNLAADQSFQRQGIATRLIKELKLIAKECDAWVIFVQADASGQARDKALGAACQKQETAISS